MSRNMKTWATPAVGATFLIMSITGILLFFHIDIGIIEPVHKWAGWILVVTAIAHLLANAKPFTAHLKSFRGVSIIAAGAVVLALSFYPWAGEESNPMKKALGALQHASVESVSSIAGTSSDELVARLEAHGITVGNTADSLQETARNNGESVREILAIIFE
ncbi:DUF4405 domain-containing protein [Prosthecochloris sp. ZM_2]|uniref:DUF4405 domain-containing protein n=1 Tax=Prosthecochloris sp. ZM_2 TaxID=2045206 RepID=UPI000DF77F24|nr:DUF4405 domain-containing protein [Prosthecochloris sp. ZM_2]RNA65073.1 DUF4405 domain-containing protein [Prosthecochloris sp. ZM_2]